MPRGTGDHSRPVPSRPLQTLVHDIDCYYIFESLRIYISEFRQETTGGLMERDTVASVIIRVWVTVSRDGCENRCLKLTLGKKFGSTAIATYSYM